MKTDMDEKPFSNRELEAKFEDLHKDVKATLAQTTKTNGRVNALEDRANKLENWKNFMQGGMAILTLMIVPILIYIVTHWK